MDVGLPAHGRAFRSEHCSAHSARHAAVLSVQGSNCASHYQSGTLLFGKKE